MFSIFSGFSVKCGIPKVGKQEKENKLFYRFSILKTISSLTKKTFNYIVFRSPSQIFRRSFVRSLHIYNNYKKCTKVDIVFFWFYFEKSAIYFYFIYQFSSKSKYSNSNSKYVFWYYFIADLFFVSFLLCVFFSVLVFIRKKWIKLYGIAVNIFTSGASALWEWQVKIILYSIYKYSIMLLQVLFWSRALFVNN